MLDLATIPFEQIPASGMLPAGALEVVPQNASVDQAIKALQKKHFAQEAIPVLADAMPEREAVWWASQSCEQAGDSLAPADLEASRAAAAWVSTPSPETAAAAAAAAQKAGFTGPGAFAAQSASFAQSPPTLAAGDQLGMAMAGHAAPNAAPAAAGGAMGTSLAKQTAAGAVRLAALQSAGLLPVLGAPELAGTGAAAAAATTMTAGEPPESEPEPASRKERKKASKATAPFLDLGKDIASGKNHW